MKNSKIQPMASKKITKLHQKAKKNKMVGYNTQDTLGVRISGVKIPSVATESGDSATKETRFPSLPSSVSMAWLNYVKYYY